MKTIRKGKTRLDLIMPKYSSFIKCTERIGKTRSRINNSQPKKHWKQLFCNLKIFTITDK